VSETVELRYVVDGDSSGAVGALDRAGAAADDVDDKFRRASDGVGSGFDRAGEAADTAEGRAQGFADTLTGATDVMAGFGNIARGNTFEGVLQLGTGFADLAGGMAMFVIPTLSAMTSGMLTNAAATARSTASAVANRAASIAASVASKAWAAGQWLLNAALTANPIGLVIVAIVALVAAIVIAYKRSETFRAIVQAAMRGAVAAFGWVLDKVQQLVGWIRSNWPLLLAIITGPIGLAVRFVLSRWDQIRDGVVSKTQALIGWLRGMPGRILGALGDLGGLLRNAGGRVIQGFLDGIQAGFARVRAKLSELTGMLPDWKGPERVDASILYGSGQLVAGGFEAGFVDRFTGRTRATMGDLTRTLPDVVASSTGRAGAAPAGGELHVHVHADAIITNGRQLLAMIDEALESAAGAGTYRPVLVGRG